ncbi:hypothetical protein MUK42_06714 [Musa troglodytarum]|uniref:Uncharacterized protein n=1 Tax=Musa troglodytarum TaxID=320322 RepID=A0A9E7KHU7_9LILI|nr:hypothetical protein MUK42_06714 [Musa troglodytarum]
MTCAGLVNQACVWGFFSWSSCLDKPERSINTSSEAHKLTAAGDVDGLDRLSAMPPSASAAFSTPGRSALRTWASGVSFRSIRVLAKAVTKVGGDSERERKVSKTLLRRMKEMLVQNRLIRKARGLVVPVCRACSLLMGSKWEQWLEVFIAWEVTAPVISRLCKDGCGITICISFKRTRNKQRKDT